MLTSAQLRKRALRRKRDAIHAGERRRDQRDGFWDDLFRATGTEPQREDVREHQPADVLQ
jgi:hypothetical protein